MFSPEEEGRITETLNRYLRNRTTVLLDTFDMLLGIKPGSDDALKSTDQILEFFNGFTPVEFLRVPLRLDMGRTRAEVQVIDSRMFDMVVSGYPWFWGVSEVLSGIESIKTAIDLEGMPTPDIDAVYLDWLRMLFYENRGKSEREKWIGQIEGNLRPVEDSSSDYIISTQKKFIAKFSQVVDKFFPINK